MAPENSGSRQESGPGDAKSTGSRSPWGRDSGRRTRRRRLPLRAPAKSWDGHVCDMEELANSPGFRRLRAEIITLAGLTRSDRVLDIGAGTGLLTLAAARDAAHVTALDISPSMCRHLEAKLARCAIDNVDVRAGTASELPLADGSIDVILSNYCFHHLRDPDKLRALSEAIRVLRPGGRFVAGDMMFQIGLTHARDRAVLARFAGRMLRLGPAGLMRLLRNLLRVASGRGEHPASTGWWRDALNKEGFVDVLVRALEHEGGIATARRPALDQPPASHPTNLISIVRAFPS